jgi:transposase-like protein
VSVWNWIQRFGTCTIYKRKRVSAFIIDEIMIQIGNKHYWLRICIESVRRSVFRNHTSQARNILALYSFLESFVSKDDRHSVYSDRATCYLEACKKLEIKHYLHSSVEKSLIERIMQYFKDRTESLMITILV